MNLLHTKARPMLAGSVLTTYLHVLFNVVCSTLILDVHTFTIYTSILVGKNVRLSVLVTPTSFKSVTSLKKVKTC